MAAPVKMTTTVAQVLSCFLADVDAERYGLDLMRDTGLPSGTLYPILARLQRAGWLRASWEDIDPEAAGRPARRYYLLTPDGAATARTELAGLRDKLAKALGPIGRTQTT
ncbi:MAG TPA: helix-turn-helix transcriptional regulator [Stackebrandtia sp.]|jgi:DNA-binding PadR family transcriptional regulator|uniref:PadR family transcriptional regulator n=1 Tax=Stackebrandtia sp. TaxID=2023065 RepID=UPI002D2AA3FC|nr:helix-turn-helix transcriptional regulator [Stackebrandtia sp.]HZE40296.1 helix-turn-helix transcriptional regulator [Stackebrandtia sp.]